MAQLKEFKLNGYKSFFYYYNTTSAEFSSGDKFSAGVYVNKQYQFAAGQIDAYGSGDKLGEEQAEEARTMTAVWEDVDTDVLPIAKWRGYLLKNGFDLEKE